jgi:hypothetical protein
VAARNMRVADPGHIVWDEIVAIWIVLWLAMPMGFAGQLVAFALFRYFDAAKPGPVAWADQLFKGFGWRVNGRTTSERQLFAGNRAQVRAAALRHGLQRLAHLLRA